MIKEKPFEAVVIGASAGGIRALRDLLVPLPSRFPLPIIVVQHLHPDSDGYLAKILETKCHVRVKQADEKEVILGGVVYIAPANYHLLIEEDCSFSLSLEAPVNFSRPSIDVLFESAAYVYQNKLIGIVLTGANHDGSFGLKQIKRLGGYAIVQDPTTAEIDIMPKFALAATPVDKVLSIADISNHLIELTENFI